MAQTLTSVGSADTGVAIATVARRRLGQTVQQLVELAAQHPAVQTATGRSVGLAVRMRPVVDRLAVRMRPVVVPLVAQTATGRLVGLAVRMRPVVPLAAVLNQSAAAPLAVDNTAAAQNLVALHLPGLLASVR